MRNGGAPGGEGKAISRGRASGLWVATEQVVVGIAFVFEGQSPETHVVQVLEPLEVRYRHTASVHEQILHGTRNPKQTTL